MMKKDIHRVNYDGSPNKNGDWWVWEEVCDRCGKVIFDESTQHSRIDDSNIDFCSECIRNLIDNNISYEQAIALYGKKKEQ
jgi:hypothetical protein